MLNEITQSEPKDGKRNRRWFTCDEFDLYVWSNDVSSIEKIQLSLKPQYSVCPDDEFFEKVITWDEAGGYCFDKVVYTQRYSTPILEKIEPFDVDQLISRFNELSSKIDRYTQEFVKNKLRQLIT